MTDNQSANTSDNETKAPKLNSAVGVRFKSCGRIYTFRVNGLEVTPGTQVVVDSEMGLSIGYVVTPKHLTEKEKLKKVVRIANARDFEKVEKNRAFEADAKAFCIEKARDLNLPMKVVATETTLDRKRIIFYFTADGRIDFRELVRDLAAKFKTRIEMRQIGVRDEVKLLGGIGACGRQTCCSLFLTSFEPITIRMAKQQELSINQSKLSGVCGRLMCCLSYEFKESERISQGEIVAITEGRSTPDVVSFDSETVCIDEMKRSVCTRCSMHNGKAVVKQTQQEDGAKNRRHRRRHRRRKKSKVLQDKQEPASKAVQDVPQKKENQETQKTEKGKPFSKRRKFWKKKKTSR